MPESETDKSAATPSPWDEELKRTAFQKKAVSRLRPGEVLDLATAFFSERGYRAGRTGRPNQVFVMGKGEGILPRVTGEISARSDVGKPGVTLATLAPRERLCPLIAAFYRICLRSAAAVDPADAPGSRLARLDVVSPLSSGDRYAYGLLAPAEEWHRRLRKSPGIRCHPLDSPSSSVSAGVHGGGAHPFLVIVVTSLRSPSLYLRHAPITRLSGTPADPPIGATVFNAPWAPRLISESCRPGACSGEAPPCHCFTSTRLVCDDPPSEPPRHRDALKTTGSRPETARTPTRRLSVCRNSRHGVPRDGRCRKGTPAYSHTSVTLAVHEGIAAVSSSLNRIPRATCRDGNSHARPARHPTRRPHR